MSLMIEKPTPTRIPDWLRSAWGAALLLTVVYTLVYAGFSVFQFGGGDLGATLANISYLPVGLAATIFTWRIAANKRFERRLRLAWLLIGLGIFSQFAGDVSWLVMESILGIEPYPSIADVFYLGTYPFLLWGMLTFPMQKANISERIRLLLDALIAIVAGALLMWFFLIRPAMEAAEGDLLSVVVGASYPIGDLILFIGITVISYRNADPKVSGSVKYLALGVGFFFAADVIYAFITDEYVSGMWLDNLWLASFIMFSMAAMYQAQVKERLTTQSWAKQVERWMRVVITLISFASYVWMIYALSTQKTDSLTQLMLLASGMALSALLVSRQWLTVRENQVLLQQSLKDRAVVEELSQTLEQRVEERTTELLVAADVVRRVSVVRNIEELLHEAVHTIADRFNLYYVQIYLLDHQSGTLILKTGSGEVGNILRNKGHRLALSSSSINATAAHERRSVLVEDTKKSDTFRPNPLLPETRCELAVPLIYQNRVLGVLDMQGSQPGELNKEKLPVFEALAGQLSISIENSNLHESSKAAMQRAEEQAALLTRTGWRAFMDGINRTETLGYITAGDRVESIQELPPAVSELECVREPIVVAGQAVGWLQVEGEQVNRSQAGDLASWVAEQAAQKIEHLRLLAQAEQYRQEAEQVVKRLTREGWEEYQKSLQDEQLGYVYDQQMVVPIASGSNGYHESAWILPLQLHNEQIGELGVVSEHGIEEADQELVGTIAEQLSTHLENLRLLEETRRAEDELANRAAEMMKVAELATHVTTQTEVGELLQSLVDQVKVSFGLYHAHIYLMDAQGEKLGLAAGAGDVGRKMVTIGWQISAASEKSLVARAARTRQAVIVNDVRADPEFLPNELLPETRSEMAVPLVVGNRVLGVLDVQSDKVERFSVEDASIQTTLASQVAVALQNAQQYRETQAALSETETLYAITSAATRSMELKEILTETLTRLLAATGYEAGLVSMVDEHSGKLYLAVHHNLPEMLHKWLKSHGMAGTLCQYVFDTGTAITLNDLADGAPVDVSGMLKMGLRCYQGAPVLAKGKVLGTICVFGYTPRLVGDAPTTLFQVAGQQIGIVIENTRLFQETQQQAEREAAINTISQRIQATTSVEEALQVAVRELGRTLGAQRATIQLGVPQREPEAAPAGGVTAAGNGNGHSAGNGAGKNGH